MSARHVNNLACFLQITVRRFGFELEDICDILHKLQNIRFVAQLESILRFDRLSQDICPRPFSEQGNVMLLTSPACAKFKENIRACHSLFRQQTQESWNVTDFAPKHVIGIITTTKLRPINACAEKVRTPQR